MRALYKQLTDVLAEYDARVVQSIIDSVPVRRAAVRAIKREDFSHFVHPSIAIAYAKIEAAGSKQWLNLLENSDKELAAKITRIEQAKADKRNAKIAARLEAVRIKSINSVHTNRVSSDNFNGVWVVDTNVGMKRVVLQVILAGGYNIQCLHARVLVNVK